mgnify:CR=1 FL=1
MIVGLRRNIDYDEAVQRVDRGDFLLGGLAYPATKIVRSPLFQRMANGIDQVHTAQTAGIIDEQQRNADMQKMSIEAGVSKADLKELMEHMTRMSQSQGGASMGGNQPPPGGGGYDSSMGGGGQGSGGGTAGSSGDVQGPPGRDVAREAADMALRAQMQQLLEEQAKMNRHLAVANEARTKLEAQNAKDSRAEIIREIHSYHGHPLQVPVPQTPPDNRPMIHLIANQLEAQNNNISEVAKNLNMSVNEIANVLQQNVQNNTNLNFAPTLINHNNVFQNLTQNLMQRAEVFSMATPVGSRAASVQPIPLGEDQGEVIPVQERARSRSQKRTTESEKETPQLRKAIRDKSREPEIEIIPVPSQNRRRPRSRQAIEDEPTPQVRRAIMDKQPEADVEIIPQLQPRRAIQDRPTTMGEPETPQVPIKRALQILTQKQKNKEAQFAGVQHLGNAVLRAKSRLQTKRAAERRASIVAPRSASEIITEIESKGMPGDLSPRMRKPMKLQMDTFRGRPQVGFGPASRRIQRSMQNFV